MLSKILLGVIVLSALLVGAGLVTDTGAQPGGETIGGDNGDTFYFDDAGFQRANYVLSGLRRTRIPVPETYYPAGAPGGATTDAIVRAVTAWNAVTPTFQFTLTTAGTGGPLNHICGPDFTPYPRGADGINAITWSRFTGGAIGVACWNGLDECDIALDSGWAATQSSEAIRTVLTHEAGHCAGLGHSAVTEAVMYATYYTPKGLAADDIAGICALYGCTSVPPTATPIRTQIATPTVIVIPTATVPPTPKRKCELLYCVRLPFVARD